MLPSPVKRLERRLRTIRRRLLAGCFHLLRRHEDAAVQCACDVPGFCKHDELRLLYRTAGTAPDPGDVAEIGSWKGRTTITLARALKDHGIAHCRVFAIDHHQGSEEHRDEIGRRGSTLSVFRQNLRAAAVTDVIETLVMEAPQAAEILAQRGIQLRMLFIDGAHDEGSVRRDIRAFLPLVRLGGIIALHDCEPGGAFPGVWKAFQSELAGRVEVVARASSLMVTRRRA